MLAIRVLACHGRSGGAGVSFLPWAILIVVPAMVASMGWTTRRRPA